MAHIITPLHPDHYRDYLTSPMVNTSTDITFTIWLKIKSFALLDDLQWIMLLIRPINNK